MEFKEKLYNLRKSRGYSQEELGEKIEVTRQTISNWESGLSTPDMDSIVALAKEFNISTDELLSYKQNDDPIVHIESKGNNIYGLHVNLFRGSFEYKSKKMIGNLPLVHINYGFGHHVAKGVIAIGNIAIGIVSIGLISVGVLAFGLLAIGILALGTFAAGLLSFGSMAIGLMAFGALAYGIISYGAVAGGMYTIGAFSAGSQISFGAKASGNLAFSTENGTISFTKEYIAAAIDAKYPQLWSFIRNLFVALGE
jgi:transcriptional regulator with XRE-family HTH domain